MPTVARLARALILIGAALTAAGGGSLALPVAHLFSDHHHEIVYSAANGTWQWVVTDDHHPDAATLEAERHGHSELQIGETTPPLRSGRAISLSVAPVSTAVLDAGHDSRIDACCHGPADSPPDVGKPDLALLATMRV